MLPRPQKMNYFHFGHSVSSLSCHPQVRIFVHKISHISLRYRSCEIWLSQQVSLWTLWAHCAPDINRFDTLIPYIVHLTDKTGGGFKTTTNSFWLLKYHPVYFPKTLILWYQVISFSPLFPQTTCVKMWQILRQETEQLSLHFKAHIWHSLQHLRYTKIPSPGLCMCMYFCVVTVINYIFCATIICCQIVNVLSAAHDTILPAISIELSVKV